MGSFSSNAILAKARSMYSRHLTPKDYDELSKKRTIDDVAAYLKSETGYSDALDNISGKNVRREELEALLAEEADRKLSRMIRYASKDELEFYHIGLVETEMSMLLYKARTMNTDEGVALNVHVPKYMIRLSSFNLYGLLNVNNYDELLNLINGTTYYDTFYRYRPNNGVVNFNELERALKKEYYEYYIRTVKKLFKGSVQKDLLTMLYTNIELQNISKIYRLKKYFNCPSDRIRDSLFLEYSRIPTSLLNQMIDSKDVDDLLKLLADSPYKLYVDDNDYVFIEYHTKKIVYNLAKRYMRFSTNSALVYMTYKFVQNVEIDNLKHIIEGLRYGQSASQIKEMLIY